MKKKLRENLALLLFVLLVFCFAQAFNSSSPQTQVITVVTQTAGSNFSCPLPGCGYDPYFAVENLVHTSSLRQSNH